MAIEFIEGKFHKVNVEQDSDASSPREEENLGTMVCWHRNYNLGDEQPKQSPEDFRRDLACQFDDKLEDRLERIDNRFNNMIWDRQVSKDAKEAIQSAIDKVLEQHIVELPLYLYDHSGITMSTGAFSCQWDSGQVGFNYITKDKIRAEYGWKNLTQARRERIEGYLKNEVQRYDDYLTGQVYGFTHEVAELPEDWAYLALLDAQKAKPILEKYLDLDDDLDWEHEGSCWGFFGDDIKTNGILEHLDAKVHHLAEAA